MKIDGDDASYQIADESAFNDFAKTMCATIVSFSSVTMSMEGLLPFLWHVHIGNRFWQTLHQWSQCLHSENIGTNAHYSLLSALAFQLLLYHRICSHKSSWHHELSRYGASLIQ